MTSRRLFSLLCALAIVMAYLPFDQALAQSSGNQGNGDSEEATVSADGRYVAFFSTANNIVPDDTNAIGDVFVRDRSLAVTHRVSVSSSGVQANGFVDHPQISPDGRYVVFESGATNLVSGDSNGAEDVFVRDLTSGTTSRVSVSSSGAQGNAVSEHAHMSSDGRYVVFESEATNLVSSDTNAAQDIFVRDRSLGTTMRVSTNSSGTQANGTSFEPVISPDGRYVGFHSAATNLVSNDSNDDWDIYIKDLSNGAIVRASLSSNENQTTERSANAWLSDQALQIAFESDATNLVSGDTNADKDIFVRDRIATTTERASVSSSGSQGDRDSQWPSISSNGRYVAFESFATNLVSGDANGKRDVFLRDRSAGTTTRVSVSSSGQEANDFSTVGMVAGGGGHVVFDSGATNLIPQDTNGFDDVFIRDPSSGATSLVSVTSGNRPPTASLSVTPEQGDTNTTFTATITGSDPDGDALTYEIDWGDGAVTEARTGTHQYSAPGDYSVIGTVTDSYGATASDEVTVRVCQSLSGGVCVRGDIEDGELCSHSPVECPPPIYDELPKEVRDAVDSASDTIGTAADAANDLLTPNGRVLVVTANVEQVHANRNDQCDIANPEKDCWEERREEHFVERLEDLAERDGMGYLPDVILLQEVRFGEDVEDMRRHLNELPGVQYRFAAGAKGEPIAPDDEAGVTRHCNSRYPEGTPNYQDKREACRRRIRLLRDTAIIYNSETVRKIAPNPNENPWYQAEYTETEADDCPANLLLNFIDMDDDGQHDCNVKWTRAYMAHFAELRLNSEGEPTNSKTGLQVATASAHLVTASHFKDQLRSDPDDERGDIHESKKEEWAKGISRKLERIFPSASSYVIGGDFNIHRCANKAPSSQGAPAQRDWPESDPECVRRTPKDWWETMTSPRTLPGTDARGYRDTVRFKHRAEDERLHHTFRDGCNVALQDGACPAGDEHFRRKRVDFLFHRRLTTAQALHDMTCGERTGLPQGTEPHCDEEVNPERYSDHRLVWLLIRKQ